MISADRCRLDKEHLWHPFTPMREWCEDEHEPLALVRGEGCWLWDQQGRRYLDGNSSIWTNIHGHGHPVINTSIKAQLEQVAHTSFLGFTHEPAMQLGKELAELAGLPRVFFSDDGSTAIECAVRMALQFWQQNGGRRRTKMVAFDAAYHGDTLGAASLGGIPLFKGAANHFGYEVWRVKDLTALAQLDAGEIGAVIVEPLIQGSAGMRVWPKGMLKQLEGWCREHDVFLILDEVMTGFGRTGTMFACQQEDVLPDFLCLAKGLTGGYLPMAATLTTERVFEGFYGEGRAFYYGHSYTASQLGCAAALGSLQVFREEAVMEKLGAKIGVFADLVEGLAAMPQVLEVRRCGMIAGIELRGQPPGTGARVCVAARKHGLLTRPVLNTLVLMPPLSVTETELAQMVEALRRGMEEICE
jgi:adenosylmethionine-8-amino-7-oxononanoate aminotransferase